MSIHVHVAHHYVEEITVYADSEPELHQWVATWESKHQTASPQIIPLSPTSCIVQSRVNKK